MGNPGSVLDRMLRFRWGGEDPVDPVDPAQNSLRLTIAVRFLPNLRENDRHLWGVEL